MRPRACTTASRGCCGTWTSARLLDVGCADGVLRRALPSAGPWLVGLDAAVAVLRAHPSPVVRRDAVRLPFARGAFDAVTALNVLYHLPAPLRDTRHARVRPLAVDRCGLRLRVETPDGDHDVRLAWQDAANTAADLRRQLGLLVGCPFRDPTAERPAG